MTDSNPLDLLHRLTVGDWAAAGLTTFDGLVKAGEIVLDPDDESRRKWVDRDGNSYTLHAIQSTSWIARHTREQAAQVEGRRASGKR
jgi:hypothetical protein